MKMKVAILFFAAISMASCASYFKRKECEKVNWFEYGQKVAQKGQNLENDQLIGECRKAEAEMNESALDQGFKKGRELYCHPTGAFQTGKKGEVFSTTMCEGYNTKVLVAKYNEGIKEFCQTTNGEPYGATGQVYQNVCPKNMEAGFLVGYKVGRKKYLTATISQREDEVDQLERDIRLRRRDQSNAQDDARRAESNATETVTVKEFDARTGRYTEVRKQQENPNLKLEADRHKQRADQLGYEIREKQTKADGLRNEIRTLKTELMTL